MERLGWATVGAVFGGTAVWAASRFIGSRRQDEGEDATPEILRKHSKALGATAASPVQSGTLGPMGGRNSEVGSGLGPRAFPPAPKTPQK